MTTRISNIQSRADAVAALAFDDDDLDDWVDYGTAIYWCWKFGNDDLDEPDDWVNHGGSSWPWKNSALTAELSIGDYGDEIGAGESGDDDLYELDNWVNYGGCDAQVGARKFGDDDLDAPDDWVNYGGHDDRCADEYDNAYPPRPQLRGKRSAVCVCVCACTSDWVLRRPLAILSCCQGVSAALTSLLAEMRE